MSSSRFLPLKTKFPENLHVEGHICWCSWTPRVQEYIYICHLVMWFIFNPQRRKWTVMCTQKLKYTGKHFVKEDTYLSCADWNMSDIFRHMSLDYCHMPEHFLNKLGLVGVTVHPSRDSPWSSLSSSSLTSIQVWLHMIASVVRLSQTLMYISVSLPREWFQEIKRIMMMHSTHGLFLTCTQESRLSLHNV